MKKTAFTMIELVFVIVVLGILAALALPRMDRDLRQGAKDNLLAAIHYTQHLALIDNKTNPFDNTWQSKLWSISFATDGSDYTISSDGNVTIDPANGKPMDGSTGGSPSVLIGKKYGITNIGFAGGCTSTLIAFDHLGRPFTAVSGAGNNYANYMSSDCTITATFQGGINPLILTILSETGFASGD